MCICIYCTWKTINEFIKIWGAGRSLVMICKADSSNFAIGVTDLTSNIITIIEKLNTKLLPINQVSIWKIHLARRIVLKILGETKNCLLRIHFRMTLWDQFHRQTKRMVLEGLYWQLKWPATKSNQIINSISSKLYQTIFS